MEVHASSPSTCHILKLPLEVLLRITDLIKTPDLGHMRLTCREIEGKLFDSFTKEFFFQKQFMITELSLQTLIDISKSRLGPHLRRIHFGIDTFEDPSRYRQQGGVEFFDENSVLWSSGVFGDMLTEAFSTIPEIEDIIIRDFNSPNRIRDFPHHYWRSYGMGTSMKQGARFEKPTDFAARIQPAKMIASRMLNLILWSLARSDARPSGIEGLLRYHNNWKDQVFALPARMMPKLVPILKNLTKLHLAIRTPDYTVHGGAMRSLRIFLTHCSNLKDLRINDVPNGAPGVEDVVAAIGHTALKGTVMERAIPRDGVQITFEHLEALSLGFMTVDPRIILGAVMAVAPTLRTLQLWKMRITRDPERKNRRRTAKLRNLLSKLTEVLDLELTEIKMGFISEDNSIDDRDPRGMLVTFNGEEIDVAYKGPDWRRWVSGIDASTKWDREIATGNGIPTAEDDAGERFWAAEEGEENWTVGVAGMDGDSDVDMDANPSEDGLED